MLSIRATGCCALYVLADDVGHMLYESTHLSCLQCISVVIPLRCPF